MKPSTFSIVALDRKTGDLGIAVESKFLAVGAVVPWAAAGAGAIATQSYANTSYGPHGLRLLRRGLTPRQVGHQLTSRDKQAAQRQFGIVDARGRSYTYTGEGCYPWAGGIAGKHFAAQGNILANERVVEAMAETFQQARGELAERLLAALAAGQAEGGDRRGQESAALLVVRAKGGYAGFNDRYIDLRVDDHPQPIDELARILALHRMYMGAPRPEDRVPIDAELARELQRMMRQRRYDVPETAEWDEATRRGFREFAGVENLEDRLYDGPYVDRIVLEYLRDKFG